MIIWIILILSITTFLSWLIISNRTLRYISTSLSILCLILSIGLLSANMSQHFGMNKIQNSKTQQIYSAGPINSKLNTVVVKKIGTNNVIVVYKDKPTSSEATSHFTPSKNILKSIKMTSKVYISSKNTSASVTKSLTKWEYKNSIYEFLFKTKNTDNLIAVDNHINLPSDWKIVEK